ncbi:E3 ubiquitin-protein ligase TRIM56-like [Patiria miniata]|uniref:Tripartite motif-containing protein 2-like n=1 Tax=Patiria miniata TaxID=46514 RepID=A0A914AR63_PATMI|nr:E3 ubiquitin-protein ligase TRIM56-like [Patiria miniata]XP_038066148.1 E3 ubiquitin-protein ligase TRIM56-like [Patiria miniata]
MATAASLDSALEKIGVHLECSICTGKYKQPKVLNCLHSFCEECLVKYRDGTYGGAPQIPCPMCRQETVLPQTGIQGLKTNFHLVGMIAEFELQEKVACSGDSKLLCETCDEDNEPLHHCFDCGKNICTPCRKTHLRFPVSAKHAVATLDDIRQGKVKVTKQPDQYKCNNHKESVKFYCKTCDELICQVCTVVGHPTAKHDITDTGTASKDYRQSLRNAFSALGKDIQGLELCLQDTIEAKMTVKDNMAKARKGVQDKAAEVIAKVKAEEKRLLDEITTHELEQSKGLDEHEKTLSDMLHRKRHSHSTGKDVTSNASDCNLISLYPVISKDLTKLSSQHLAQYPHKLWYLRFKRSQTAGVIDLGKVEQEGDKWELQHKLGKQGSGEGEFELARGIAVAADPDEIAVADCKNKRVVICNHQGQTKNTIQVVANDVVVVSNQWVCAHSDKMMVYHRDTTHKCDFHVVPEVGNADNSLLSVAIMPNGNIIAGLKKKVLIELDPRDGDILHTMPVKIRPGFLVVLSNGWIVISDWKQGLVEIVEVSNGNAVTVNTIRPTIDGKPVKYCKGVCSKSSGIYIAADTGYIKTGHIHHYNCTGQFVSCVAQGLYDPYGITFTADGQQLAVADRYSVKIYHKV